MRKLLVSEKACHLGRAAAAAAATAAAASLQSCSTLCDPIDSSPPGSPVPGILQARTRVGCHVLPQCMKVESESEVALLCPTRTSFIQRMFIYIYFFYPSNF